MRVGCAADAAAGRHAAAKQRSRCALSHRRAPSVGSRELLRCTAQRALPHLLSQVAHALAQVLCHLLVLRVVEVELGRRQQGIPVLLQGWQCKGGQAGENTERAEVTT